MAKILIDRVAWGFRNDGILPKMEERFIPFSQFLQRLLLETYQGKRMEYIIVYFRALEAYKNGRVKRMPTYYHRGNLSYYGEIDLDSFNRLSPNAQVGLFLIYELRIILKLEKQARWQS